MGEGRRIQRRLQFRETSIHYRDYIGTDISRRSEKKMAATNMAPWAVWRETCTTLQSSQNSRDLLRSARSWNRARDNWQQQRE